MTKTLPNSLVLAAALLLSAAACGDDNDDPKPSGGNDAGTGDSGVELPSDLPSSATSAQILDRIQDNLVACSVISDSASPQLPAISAPSDKCSALCLANADCDDLAGAICLDDPSSAFASCFNGCEFKCKDGTVSNDPDQPIVECDGYDDCDDKSDEANCAGYYFACADGDKVSSAYKCDGQDDCTDGSDEKGCPADFECDDGDTFPASYKCDLVDDCDDGSDEKGCELSCGG